MWSTVFAIYNNKYSSLYIWSQEDDKEKQSS